MSNNNDSENKDNAKITWIFVNLSEKPVVKEFRKLLRIKKGGFVKAGGEFDLVIDMVSQIHAFMNNSNIADALFDNSNRANYVFNTSEICTKDFLLLRFSENIIAGYLASPIDIGKLGSLHNDLRELAIKSMKANNFLVSVEEDMLEELDSDLVELRELFGGNPFDDLRGKLNGYFNPKIEKLKNEILDWHKSHSW